MSFAVMFCLTAQELRSNRATWTWMEAKSQRFLSFFMLQLTEKKKLHFLYGEWNRILSQNLRTGVMVQ